ncbi:MAG: acetylglutamate kinase [Bdellovibrionales bacterium]|nr:acetylglutamate kinase [Bdellovibrionales bacterium]
MTREIEDTQAKAEVLSQALSYIRRFTGKRVLIKVGGELFENEAAAKSLASDLSFLRTVGVDVVLVHGGGPQISKAMKQFRKEPVFVKGQRQTDSETLDLTAMVLLGDINRRIVSLLNVAGARSIGLSGADDSMLLVEQLDPELGFVGTVREVNTDPIDRLLEYDYIPVIAGMGVDRSGQLYNVNADSVAGKIAVAIGAEKYILLTNVPGLYETFGEEDSLISEIDSHGLIRLISTNKLSEGMIPKVESILSALKGGVKDAHILDGRMVHSVLLEIFTPEGIGTMVKNG